MTTATTAVMTLFVTASAVPGDAERRRWRPPSLDRLAHSVGDLVLALEEAEPARAAREVLDVARQRVDEVVDLVDQDRHEGRSERGDRRAGRRRRRSSRRAPRRCTPWAWSHSTAGLSASARKTATRIQISTLRATWMTWIRTKAARMIPSTTEDRTRPELDEALLHRGEDTPGIGWSSETVGAGCVWEPRGRAPDRVRTGDQSLEGSCVTTTPRARVEARLAPRGAGSLLVVVESGGAAR